MATNDQEPASTNDNYDPTKEKAEHEAAEGLGAAAATGLGCLGFAFMPFTFMILIFLVFVVSWVIYRAITGS